MSRTINRDGRARIAVGYLRRSTDRQEQSIPDQQRAIEQFALNEGLRLEHFYIDDAISGTSALGRRAFQQLIQDAQKPGCSFGFVIVYDVKRFGRGDNDEAGYYRHVLKTHGVEVLYASEGFNGSDTDDLLRPVKQWQARQESRDLSKVTIRGLLSKQPAGVWMGGVPPHGYDLRYESDRGEFLFILRHLPDGTKQMLDQKDKVVRTLLRGETVNISKRDRAKLIPGEKPRVEVVKRIFRMYTEQSKGFAAIADALNTKGVPTPRGPKWARIYSGTWGDSTIRAILVNPLYVGDMVWNRRSDGRFHKISNGHATERKSVHGARLEPNDANDWLVVRDAHPPLVSRKTFELARQIREGKPTAADQAGVPKRPGGVGEWNGARSRFILSGLVVCGRCGTRYQGCKRTKGKRRNDGSRVVTSYYGCGGYIAKGRSVCSFGPIGQKLLESKVIEAVLSFYKRYDGAEGASALSRVVRDHLGAAANDLSEARQRVEKGRERIEATIRKLLDNISPSTRDMVEGRLAELRRERDALVTRGEELERMSAEEDEVQVVVQDVGRFLSSLPFTLEYGLPEEKKAALRQCIMAIEVCAPDNHMRIRVRLAPSAGESPRSEAIEIHIDELAPGSSQAPV